MKYFLLLTLAAASIASATPASPKPTIVLIHGEFESAVVWQRVSAKLKEDGYPVLAVTLPGRPGGILSFDRLSIDLYSQAVLQAIAQESDPVVLVGHSFGAMTISAVAEAAPEKIKTLVYLAAYVPHNGDAWLSLAKQDHDSKLQPNLILDQPRNFASVERTARADLFAADGAPEFRRTLPDLMVDEPLFPMMQALHLSAARFGRVDKVHIRTTLDQVVSPAMQATSAAAAAVRQQYTLNTGHTPFITDAPGLVRAIEQAAEPVVPGGQAGRPGHD